MRGERQLLRLGEYLVDRASRRLPRRIRAERYREWAAELPVILHDPQISLAPRRAVRMVVYAADTLRGTALMHVRGQRRSARLLTAAGVVLVTAGLTLASLSVWNIALAPGRPVSYLQLAWALLVVAWPISLRARPAARATKMGVGSILMGAAVNLWQGVQYRDWENYFMAATLALLFPALWLVSRWARARRAQYRKT